MEIVTSLILFQLVANKQTKFSSDLCCVLFG